MLYGFRRFLLDVFCVVRGHNLNITAKHCYLRVNESYCV